MLRSAAFWIFIVIVVLGLGPPGSAHSQSPPTTKTQRDTVALDPDGKVEVDNRTGSITVTTWDRPQVGYEVTLTPSEGDSTVGVEPDIDHSDREVSFGHDHSWSIQIPGLVTISPDGTSEPTGHYRIVMPKTAELEIDDFDSTIEVSDVEAKVDVDTHQGEVTLRDVEGELTLETFSSPAEVTGFRGAAELETHSGRITVAFEEFTAASSAETHSGPLRFFLPADAGFELQLDLDAEDLTVDEAFGTPSTDDERRIYNGGGPELQLESFSGPVEIRPGSARGGSSSSP